MSNRRAVNRTERRQTTQELHLVRRELENVPTIYTEDEVAAARAEAIESISNHHYNMLRNSIAIAKLDWDDTIEALDIEVGELRAVLNEIRNVEAFLFLESHRAFNRSMDISRSVTELSSRVDAILAVFSLVTDERRDQAHRAAAVIGHADTLTVCMFLKPTLGVLLTPITAGKEDTTMIVGLCIFIIILAVVLYGCLVAQWRSASELQSTVNALRYRAREDKSRLEYYRKEIDRRQEHSRRSAEEITRMAVQYEAEQERAAREARLKNARDAAEAIRARIGGKA